MKSTIVHTEKTKDSMNETPNTSSENPASRQAKRWWERIILLMWIIAVGGSGLMSCAWMLLGNRHKAIGYLGLLAIIVLGTYVLLWLDRRLSPDETH